jgi:hypothetical protein
MRRDDFYRNIAADIERCKRSVLGVAPCADDPDDTLPFSYTIGNQLRGLPELLIVCPLEAGLGALNILSDLMIERGRAFDDGELVGIGGKLPVKVICADQRARDEFTVQAGQFFGTEDYDVQQVLAPDRSGRFPGEPDCDPPYRDVPVLKAKPH